MGNDVKSITDVDESSTRDKDPNLKEAKVVFLNGRVKTFVINKRSTGGDLFEEVIGFLHLNEKEYFSLSFNGPNNSQLWLYNDKRISKQFKGEAWIFSFLVKFYPSDPTLLIDDLTRYQMCLQIRDDIYTGRIPATFATHALLGSYIAQSELGDYKITPEYDAFLRNSHLAPVCSEALLEKLREFHQCHKGQTAPEAVRHYLENAKKLSLYGISITPAKQKGRDQEDVNIGVCAYGINVYCDKVLLHRFRWEHIIKIAYRHNVFAMKVWGSKDEKDESNLFFKFIDCDIAERVWKFAVENHTFFRLIRADEKPRKSFLPWSQDKFCYQGRTQFQTKIASQMFGEPFPFGRSLSGNLDPPKRDDVLLDRHETYLKYEHVPASHKLQRRGEVIKGGRCEDDTKKEGAFIIDENDNYSEDPDRCKWTEREFGTFEENIIYKYDDLPIEKSLEVASAKLSRGKPSGDQSPYDMQSELPDERDDHYRISQDSYPQLIYKAGNSASDESETHTYRVTDGSYFHEATSDRKPRDLKSFRIISSRLVDDHPSSYSYRDTVPPQMISTPFEAQCDRIQLDLSRVEELPPVPLAVKSVRDVVSDPISLNERSFVGVGHCEELAKSKALLYLKNEENYETIAVEESSVDEHERVIYSSRASKKTTRKRPHALTTESDHAADINDGQVTKFTSGIGKSIPGATTYESEDSIDNKDLKAGSFGSFVIRKYESSLDDCGKRKFDSLVRADGQRLGKHNIKSDKEKCVELGCDSGQSDTPDVAKVDCIEMTHGISLEHCGFSDLFNNGFETRGESIQVLQSSIRMDRSPNLNFPSDSRLKLKENSDLCSRELGIESDGLDVDIRRVKSFPVPWTSSSRMQELNEVDSFSMIQYSDSMYKLRKDTTDALGAYDADFNSLAKRRIHVSEYDKTISSSLELSVDGDRLMIADPAISVRPSDEVEYVMDRSDCLYELDRAEELPQQELFIDSANRQSRRNFLVTDSNTIANGGQQSSLSQLRSEDRLDKFKAVLSIRPNFDNELELSGASPGARSSNPMFIRDGNELVSDLCPEAEFGSTVPNYMFPSLSINESNYNDNYKSDGPVFPGPGYQDQEHLVAECAQLSKNSEFQFESICKALSEKTSRYGDSPDRLQSIKTSGSVNDPLIGSLSDVEMSDMTEHGVENFHSKFKAKVILKPQEFNVGQANNAIVTATRGKSQLTGEAYYLSDFALSKGYAQESLDHIEPLSELTTTPIQVSVSDASFSCRRTSKGRCHMLAGVQFRETSASKSPSSGRDFLVFTSSEKLEKETEFSGGFLSNYIKPQVLDVLDHADEGKNAEELKKKALLVLKREEVQIPRSDATFVGQSQCTAEVLRPWKELRSLPISEAVSDLSAFVNYEYDDILSNRKQIITSVIRKSDGQSRNSAGKQCAEFPSRKDFNAREDVTLVSIQKEDSQQEGVPDFLMQSVLPRLTQEPHVKSVPNYDERNVENLMAWNGSNVSLNYDSNQAIESSRSDDYTVHDTFKHLPKWESYSFVSNTTKSVNDEFDWKEEKSRDIFMDKTDHTVQNEMASDPESRLELVSKGRNLLPQTELDVLDRHLNFRMKELPCLVENNDPVRSEAERSVQNDRMPYDVRKSNALIVIKSDVRSTNAREYKTRTSSDHLSNVTRPPTISSDVRPTSEVTNVQFHSEVAHHETVLKNLERENEFQRCEIPDFGEDLGVATLDEEGNLNDSGSYGERKEKALIVTKSDDISTFANVEEDTITNRGRQGMILTSLPSSYVQTVSDIAEKQIQTESALQNLELDQELRHYKISDFVTMYDVARSDVERNVQAGEVSYDEQKQKAKALIVVNNDVSGDETLFSSGGRREIVEASLPSLSSRTVSSTADIKLQHQQMHNKPKLEDLERDNEFRRKEISSTVENFDLVRLEVERNVQADTLPYDTRKANARIAIKGDDKSVFSKEDKSQISSDQHRHLAKTPLFSLDDRLISETTDKQFQTTLLHQDTVAEDLERESEFSRGKISDFVMMESYDVERLDPERNGEPDEALFVQKKEKVKALIIVKSDIVSSESTDSYDHRRGVVGAPFPSSVVRPTSEVTNIQFHSDLAKPETVLKNLERENELRRCEIPDFGEDLGVARLDVEGNLNDSGSYGERKEKALIVTKSDDISTFANVEKDAITNRGRQGMILTSLPSSYVQTVSDIAEKQIQTESALQNLELDQELRHYKISDFVTMYDVARSDVERNVQAGEVSYDEQKQKAKALIVVNNDVSGDETLFSSGGRREIVDSSLPSLSSRTVSSTADIKLQHQQMHNKPKLEDLERDNEFRRKEISSTVENFDLVRLEVERNVQADTLPYDTRKANARIAIKGDDKSVFSKEDKSQISSDQHRHLAKTPLFSLDDRLISETTDKQFQTTLLHQDTVAEDLERESEFSRGKISDFVMMESYDVERLDPERNGEPDEALFVQKKEKVKALIIVKSDIVSSESTDSYDHRRGVVGAPFPSSVVRPTSEVTNIQFHSDLAKPETVLKNLERENELRRCEIPDFGEDLGVARLDVEGNLNDSGSYGERKEKALIITKSDDISTFANVEKDAITNRGRQGMILTSLPSSYVQTVSDIAEKQIQTESALQNLELDQELRHYKISDFVTMYDVARSDVERNVQAGEVSYDEQKQKAKALIVVNNDVSGDETLFSSGGRREIVDSSLPSLSSRTVSSTADIKLQHQQMHNKPKLEDLERDNEFRRKEISSTVENFDLVRLEVERNVQADTLPYDTRKANARIAIKGDDKSVFSKEDKSQISSDQHRHLAKTPLFSLDDRLISETTDKQFQTTLLHQDTVAEDLERESEFSRGKISDFVMMESYDVERLDPERNGEPDEALFVQKKEKVKALIIVKSDIVSSESTDSYDHRRGVVGAPFPSSVVRPTSEVTNIQFHSDLAKPETVLKNLERENELRRCEIPDFGEDLGVARLDVEGNLNDSGSYGERKEKALIITKSDDISTFANVEKDAITNRGRQGMILTSLPSSYVQTVSDIAEKQIQTESALQNLELDQELRHYKISDFVTMYDVARSDVEREIAGEVSYDEQKQKAKALIVVNNDVSGDETLFSSGGRREIVDSSLPSLSSRTVSSTADIKLQHQQMHNKPKLEDLERDNEFRRKEISSTVENFDLVRLEVERNVQADTLPYDTRKANARIAIKGDDKSVFAKEDKTQIASDHRHYLTESPLLSLDGRPSSESSDEQFRSELLRPETAIENRVRDSEFSRSEISDFDASDDAMGLRLNESLDADSAATYNEQKVKTFVVTNDDVISSFTKVEKGSPMPGIENDEHSHFGYFPSKSSLLDLRQGQEFQKSEMYDFVKGCDDMSYDVERSMMDEVMQIQCMARKIIVVKNDVHPSQSDDINPSDYIDVSKDLEAGQPYSQASIGNMEREREFQSGHVPGFIASCEPVFSDAALDDPFEGIYDMHRAEASVALGRDSNSFSLRDESTEGPISTSDAQLNMFGDNETSESLVFWRDLPSLEQKGDWNKVVSGGDKANAFIIVKDSDDYSGYESKKSVQKSEQERDKELYLKLHPVSYKMGNLLVNELKPAVEIPSYPVSECILSHRTVSTDETNGIGIFTIPYKIRKLKALLSVHNDNEKFGQTSYTLSAVEYGRPTKKFVYKAKPNAAAESKAIGLCPADGQEQVDVLSVVKETEDGSYVEKTLPGECPEGGIMRNAGKRIDTTVTAYKSDRLVGVPICSSSGNGEIDINHGITGLMDLPRASEFSPCTHYLEKDELYSHYNPVSSRGKAVHDVKSRFKSNTESKALPEQVKSKVVDIVKISRSRLLPLWNASSYPLLGNPYGGPLKFLKPSTELLGSPISDYINVVPNMENSGSTVSSGKNGRVHASIVYNNQDLKRNRPQFSSSSADNFVENVLTSNGVECGESDVELGFSVIPIDPNSYTFTDEMVASYVAKRSGFDQVIGEQLDAKRKAVIVVRDEELDHDVKGRSSSQNSKSVPNRAELPRLAKDYVSGGELCKADEFPLRPISSASAVVVAKSKVGSVASSRGFAMKAECALHSVGGDELAYLKAVEETPSHARGELVGVRKEDGPFGLDFHQEEVMHSGHEITPKIISKPEVRAVHIEEVEISEMCLSSELTFIQISNTIPEIQSQSKMLDYQRRSKTEVDNGGMSKAHRRNKSKMQEAVQDIEKSPNSRLPANDELINEGKCMAHIVLKSDSSFAKFDQGSLDEGGLAHRFVDADDVQASSAVKPIGGQYVSDAVEDVRNSPNALAKHDRLNKTIELKVIKSYVPYVSGHTGINYSSDKPTNMDSGLSIIPGRDNFASASENLRLETGREIFSQTCGQRHGALIQLNGRRKDHEVIAVPREIRESVTESQDHHEISPSNSDDKSKPFELFPYKFIERDSINDSEKCYKSEALKPRVHAAGSCQLYPSTSQRIVDSKHDNSNDHSPLYHHRAIEDHSKGWSITSYKFSRPEFSKMLPGSVRLKKVIKRDVDSDVESENRDYSSVHGWPSVTTVSLSLHSKQTGNAYSCAPTTASEFSQRYPSPLSGEVIENGNQSLIQAQSYGYDCFLDPTQELPYCDMPWRLSISETNSNNDDPSRTQQQLDSRYSSHYGSSVEQVHNPEQRYSVVADQPSTNIRIHKVKHIVEKDVCQGVAVVGDQWRGYQTVECTKETLIPTDNELEGQQPDLSLDSLKNSWRNCCAPFDVPGELLSCRTFTAGNRAMEAVTYQVDNNGVIETCVEHRVIIESDRDIDHDAELRWAILEATQMNPDMSVEKVEVRQESHC